MNGRGWHPLTSLYEMIHFVPFMYICDHADVWCPPTSFLGLHPWQALIDDAG